MKKYAIAYVSDETLHVPYAFIECDDTLVFAIRESALGDAAVLAEAWGSFRKIQAPAAA